MYAETCGKGVQDLTYGLKEPDFFVFDVSDGAGPNPHFFGHNQRTRLCKALGLNIVPTVYIGPHDHNDFMIYAGQTSELDKDTVREGLVATPEPERIDPKLGRVKLKAINIGYLMRKNPTDYN